ncbi:MAG: TolC family protein [Azonexus sp.]|nr:TolC family protein [Betaproteobacteria bacterium]MBK8918819.1 TolC family protein [Betaproteobacteria bacterium]MBP6034751.1 TolC family protein [Azonexus sp.]MBP6905291.1 TolC family protein [Azonexus sp.]
MRTVFGLAPILLVSLFASASAQGETALARTFAAAWQRQPAAAALHERQRGATALRAAADAWTAAPPSVEIGTRSDRFNRRNGARENEIGLVLPLWLPGERSGSQALAAAEADVAAGRGETLRLRLAQVLRESWWNWQGARNELALAGERLAAAARLREDVARRFAAGDLSRADLNQAAGVLAQSQALQAEAQAAELGLRHRLESLSGRPVGDVEVQYEPEPATAAAEHPALRELAAQSDVARRQVDLARAQSRANPELMLSTRSDRAASGEPSAQTWALALRIPFGAGPRQDARVATANAEAIEAGVELERERERLSLEVAAVRAQVAAARQQLAAAEQRAGLARENRGFYDKSFRLGESDLPTRLRIDSEAFEAERALGRARIALAQGISQWRQSLGLLPE